MTNKSHSTLYVGATCDLKKRVYEHKNKFYPDSFTAKYNLNKLVYFEEFHRIEEAIGREKQLKGGSRKSKLDLITTLNPDWKELYDEVEEWQDCFDKDIKVMRMAVLFRSSQ